MNADFASQYASNNASDEGMGLNTQRGDLCTQNILVPIEINPASHAIGYYFLNNQKFPVDGQKNLVEITGSPVKVELASLNVFTGPIDPRMQINYISSLFDLAELLDRCDMSNHSTETSLWVERIARQLNVPGLDIFMLGVAGRLHDIGKSIVSRELLVKPGPLSPDEWQLMRQHPEFSVALMEPATSLDSIKNIVRWHHEWYDGSGYPDGISGKELPIGARILSVVDAFTTMTNGRAYRRSISKEEALHELHRYSGRQFDPSIVDILTDLVLFNHFA
jgi:response regulator RpfG family c-di-GMP phosphodiesterase